MKTKKFLAILLTLVMILSLSVSALAAEEGTISEITKSGTVTGSDITVDNSSIEWYPAQANIGRSSDGWWIGAWITAPSTVTADNIDKVMYSNDGTDNLTKSFEQNNDGVDANGNYHMQVWGLVTPEWLETFLNTYNGASLTYTYKFDWTGSGSVEQTFHLYIKPQNITLNKDGQVYFKTEDGVVVVDERIGTGTGTGSITMNNAVKGETYKLYKVFDLTFAGESVSYSYTSTPAEGETDAFLTALQGNDSPFELTASAKAANTYTVALKDGKGANDIATFLKANQESLTAVTALTTGLDNASKATATTISWSNLAYGYYFIDSSLGSLITVNSTLPDVTVQEKNTYPSIKKEVASDLTDDTYQGYGDGDVIDTVKYKLTVNTGTNSADQGTGIDGNYTIIDTLPTGLAYCGTRDANDVFVGDVVIKVGDTTWTAGADKDYTISYAVTSGRTDLCVMTIELLASGALKDLQQNTDITITYTAKMDKTARFDPAGVATGNTNNITLRYKEQLTRASAVAYTYMIGGTAEGADGTQVPVIQKVDGGSLEGDTYTKALNGVKFVLSKTVDGVTKYATGADDILTGWVDSQEQATKIETKAVTIGEGDNAKIIDGVLTFKGLDAGTYILTEVETLPGYNLLTDTITVVVSNTVTTDDNGNVTGSTVNVTYQYTSKVDKEGETAGDTIIIENNTGTELPSTGGTGTTIFYVLGSVLVLAAIVLFVTKRRMGDAK